MYFASPPRARRRSMVLPTWLICTYLLHTLGELCLSPVGLSYMSKLAPPRFVGQVMGMWFLSLALGSNLAGQLSGHATTPATSSRCPACSCADLLVRRDRRRRDARCSRRSSKRLMAGREIRDTPMLKALRRRIARRAVPAEPVRLRPQEAAAAARPRGAAGAAQRERRAVRRARQQASSRRSALEQARRRLDAADLHHHRHAAAERARPTTATSPTSTQALEESQALRRRSSSRRPPRARS